MAVGLWGRITVVAVISFGTATAWRGTAISKGVDQDLLFPLFSNCQLLPEKVDI